VKLWSHWKHKNIGLLLLGILLAFFFSQNSTFRDFLLKLGGFGYLGAFLSGMLFVSTFTIATGALVLLSVICLFFGLLKMMFWQKLRQFTTK